MGESDEKWVIPAGSLDDMVDELGIEILAEPEISSALSSLNQEMRKKGLNPLSNGAQFTAYFSAIYHYAGTTEAICDQLWDVLNRGFKVHGSDDFSDFSAAAKVAFLLCKTMDETMRRSRTKSKTDAVLESRLEKWCKHLRFVLKQLERFGSVGDEFGQLVLGLCWEVFRCAKKNKQLRGEVAIIVGALAPSCGADDISINIVKLIQKDESLGDYFAECVDGWTRNEQCRGIIKALIVEMINISETTAQKGLVNLIQGLARRAPMTLSRELVMIEELIATSDTKYWAREAGLVAVAEIYKHLEINGDPGEIDKDMNMDLSQVEDAGDNELNLKEKCFVKLREHIFDRNSFARSYTLNLFKRLSTEVRLPHMGLYLERIVSRFEDNAALVRRAAVQCFNSLVNQTPLLTQLQNIEQLRAQVQEMSEKEPDHPQLNPLKVLLRDTEKMLELIKTASRHALVLLKSNCVGDTVEAIKWFYQVTVLKIRGGDLGGFRSMAVYVYSKEESVKNEVLKTYKDVYLNDRMEARVTALGLIMLIKDCSEAEASSIAKLIELIGIPAPAQREVWKLAIGGESRLGDRERAAALVLIRFLSAETLNDANVEILTDLIPQASPVMLAEVCSVLMQLRPQAKKLMTGGALESDHPIFSSLEKRISTLAKKPTAETANLILRAIKLYFHICANPTELTTNLLFTLTRVTSKLISDPKSPPQLRQDALILMLNAAGQTALQLAVFAECTVIPRLSANMDKKAKSKKKKNDDDEMDDIFGNVDTTDEMREMYLTLLENEINRGPFLMMINLITKILSSPAKYPTVIVNAAAIAMSKFMITSSTLAEEKSALFFTLLERSEDESIISSLLAAFPDLLVRHPNTVEPWTKHVLVKLHDANDVVKECKNCLNMVTELIVKGLIKPRGRLADIALLLLDENAEISSLARAFFVQFGSEGNHLLNQLPDILANLHRDDLPESEFRSISEFLFEQFTSKEKQMELMVQSLCSRFKEDDPQIWSQVALTISVMTPSEKALKKLIECAHFYIDKLENLEIRDYLLAMPAKARENTKLFNKAKESIEELELIIRGEKAAVKNLSPKKSKLRESQNIKDVKPRTQRGRAAKKAVWSSSEDEDEPMDEENEEPLVIKTSSRRRKR